MNMSSNFVFDCIPGEDAAGEGYVSKWRISIKKCDCISKLHERKVRLLFWDQTLYRGKPYFWLYDQGRKRGLRCRAMKKDDENQRLGVQNLEGSKQKTEICVV